MIRIGTSGWSYEHWFDRFYPQGLPKKKAFEYYRSKFDTVELNVSFYRLVSQKTYESWHEQVNWDFIFAVKGSRYITHVKRLKNYEEALERFMKTIAPLQNNLGPILFQLPSNYQKNLPIFELFLEGLDRRHRYAFEFRHQSWLDNDVFGILKDYNMAWVITHNPVFPYSEEITADFTYIRLHGPGQLYGTDYSDVQLKKWASKIQRWAKAGKDVFVYFNNDFNAYAPHNALLLKKML